MAPSAKTIILLWKKFTENSGNSETESTGSQLTIQVTDAGGDHKLPPTKGYHCESCPQSSRVKEVGVTVVVQVQKDVCSNRHHWTLWVMVHKWRTQTDRIILPVVCTNSPPPTPTPTPHQGRVSKLDRTPPFSEEHVFSLLNFES